MSWACLRGNLFLLDSYCAWLAAGGLFAVVFFYKFVGFVFRHESLGVLLERCDCPLAFSWLPFIPNHIFSRLSFLFGHHLFCSFGFGLFFVVDLLLHLNLVSFPVSPVFSRQYNPSFAALHYCFVAISIHLCSLFHPSRMRLSVPVDCLFSQTDFTLFVFFSNPFWYFSATPLPTATKSMPAVNSSAKNASLREATVIHPLPAAAATTKPTSKPCSGWKGNPAAVFSVS